MQPEPEPADLRAQFLEGMSHAACTVSVVTTDGPAGRAGVTVSAMSSVSADGDQPALLVCVHHLSPAATAIVDNGVFCVNVLRDDQAPVSDAFGGRRKNANGDKFSGVTWARAPSGSPRVGRCLVTFDCRVLQHLRVGTHQVIFGAVHAILREDQGSPLIYANRAYGTTASLPQHPAGMPTTIPGALRLGAYTSFAPYVLPSIFERLQLDGTAPPALVLEGHRQQLIDALHAGTIDLALTYDIDLSDDLTCEPLASLEPYALLPAGHPLAAASHVSLHDLAREPFVLLDGPPSRNYFESLFDAVGLQPSVAWRCSSVEMVRGLVGHGLGCSILVTKPANDVSYDGRALTCRPLAESDQPRSRIVLASRRNSALLPHARQFTDACRSHFNPGG